MKITVLRLLPSVLCLAVFVLTGCSTVSERPAVAQLAVQYATLKVIENNPAHAARVAEIAAFVRESAGNQTAPSVALLETAVRAQIDWSRLDAADTLLVDSLVSLVAAELSARLGDGPLAPEHVLVVAQVAGWIERAAAIGAPRTG
ncbi:hypothetical protein ASA1KI_20880 [Opitutales bacterium ASA1]|uniref:hypothetical protein n=1 Tax=Congregicoccus parvus TaxID=3081749 RepID=UPI002B2EF8D5|nr:hypothetical protein ASA1KI_20880 [Opitutales bacterium ASA1]